MADPIRATQRGGARAGEVDSSIPRLLLAACLGFSLLVALPDWSAPSVASQTVDAAPSVPAVIPDEPVLAPNPSGRLTSSKDTLAPRYQALVDSLAKRYRVSTSALEDFVAYAHAAGQATKVDPLLILAVMAVESGFNPIAESVMGAKGLMQVIPKYHPEKFVARDGQVNVLDPATNILAGAKVLREYATRTGDDLVAALGLYGGTGAGAENVYATRVLAELGRLEQVIKRPSTRSIPAPVAAETPPQPVSSESRDNASS